MLIPHARILQSYPGFPGIGQLKLNRAYYKSSQCLPLSLPSFDPDIAVIPFLFGTARRS